MTEYKQRWSESQSELQQQLKAATKVGTHPWYLYTPLVSVHTPGICTHPWNLYVNSYILFLDTSPPQETREYQLAKERAEEEMRDLSDTVEMATLDKEMAEERVSRIAKKGIVSNVFLLYFHSVRVWK